MRRPIQSIILLYTTFSTCRHHRRSLRPGKWKLPLSLLRCVLLHCELWFRGRKTPMIIIIIIAIITEWVRAYVSKTALYVITIFNSRCHYQHKKKKLDVGLGWWLVRHSPASWLWLDAKRQHISAWILPTVYILLSSRLNYSDFLFKKIGYSSTKK